MSEVSSAVLSVSKVSTSKQRVKRSKLTPEPEIQVETRTEIQEPEVQIANISDLSFKDRMSLLIKSHRSKIEMLRSEVAELQRLQREHETSMKAATKKQKKVRDYTKPRRKSGFAEPMTVSEQLYDFLVSTKATMRDPAFSPKSREEELSWPQIPITKGMKIARTDVTSHINKYIKEHNLQNPEARREIIPDATLRSIFSEPTPVDLNDPKSKKIYTYLQLQKYMSHHYPKRGTKVVEPVIEPVKAVKKTRAPKVQVQV
jgi:chromatin remodeling complex protein RSC6